MYIAPDYPTRVSLSSLVAKPKPSSNDDPSFRAVRATGVADLTRKSVYKPLAPGVNGNLTTHGTGSSNWLAGIDIDSFPGSTVGERVARAAHSIGADFLSPVATSVSGIVPLPVSSQLPPESVDPR